MYLFESRIKFFKAYGSRPIRDDPSICYVISANS